MAHYLVTARPKPDRLEELSRLLSENVFMHLRPFGKSLSYSLNNARLRDDGMAIWAEEDYCSPPLAQERAAVLDKYFEQIAVESVHEGEGWRRIEDLPQLVSK